MADIEVIGAKEDDLTDKARAEIDAALERSKRVYADLESRYGHDKAVVISELANLYTLSMVFPPLQRTALDLITHLAPLIGLTSDELFGALARVLGMLAIKAQRCDHGRGTSH